MKPRNKFEKAVLEQSKYLCPITKTQSKWAFRECIDHFAYRLPKGRTTCMDCGHSWTLNKHRKTCTCPHCRAKLQVKETFQRKLQQKHYLTTLTACGEYQVLRMFLLVAEMEKGCKAEYYALEIGQYWWNAQGRKALVAIQRILGHYVDTFSYCAPMAIRNDNEAYRYVAYSQIYPKFKVSDTLRRNGFKDDFHDIPPTTLIPALLSDSRAETLMKAKRFEHLRYFLNTPRNFDNYWQSYKIANRNGYEITDISLWCDYADTLRRWAKTFTARSFSAPPTSNPNTTADTMNSSDCVKGRRYNRNKRRQWKTKNVSRNSNPNSSVSISRTAQSKSTYWRACVNIWRRERPCTIAYSPTNIILKRTH